MDGIQVGALSWHVVKAEPFGVVPPLKLSGSAPVDMSLQANAIAWYGKCNQNRARPCKSACLEEST